MAAVLPLRQGDLNAGRLGSRAGPVKSFEISKESAPSEMEAVRSAAWSVLGQKGGHASRHEVDLALAADATCGGAPRDPQAPPARIPSSLQKYPLGASPDATYHTAIFLFSTVPSFTHHGNQDHTTRKPIPPRPPPPPQHTAEQRRILPLACAHRLVCQPVGEHKAMGPKHGVLHTKGIRARVGRNSLHFMRSAAYGGSGPSPQPALITFGGAARKEKKKEGERILSTPPHAHSAAPILETSWRGGRTLK